MLLEFRNIVWSLVQYFLETQGFDHRNNFNSKQILEYKEEVFETLAETLKKASESIENIEEISLKKNLQ